VTEVGLIKYLMHSDIDVMTYLANKENDGFIEFQIPFNSKRKRATTAIRHPDGHVRVFVKGAPEIVIEYCQNQIVNGGEPQELTEEMKEEITGEKVIKKFASKCYRTLLVAYTDYLNEDWEALKADNNNFETEADREVVEQDLNMVAIFGLMDPLRPGIKQAIA